MGPLMHSPHPTTGACVRRSRRPPRGGFVLLLALVLIAVAGVLLVGLARHSLQLATELRATHDDLQRRWGTVFLARALLSDPEPLIAAHAAKRSPADPRLLPVTDVVTLRDLPFEVTLDDESRKLNVNRLCAAVGVPRATETLKQLAGPGATLALRPAGVRRLSPQEFDSWGHVIELPSTLDARQQRDQLAAITCVCTCWGSGKVRVQRCPDQVLHRIGLLAAGPITANQLVALRAADPGLNTATLLDRLAVDGRKRALLEGWLSDESHCHAVWILCGTTRATLDLYVRTSAGGIGDDLQHFRW